MRLSTIAVCVLLVFPPAVPACIEHDPEQTKWVQEMSSSSRETAWAGVGAVEWDGASGMLLFGAGSASVALVLLSCRAFCRAARSEGAGAMKARTEGPEGELVASGAGLPSFLAASP
jgi:hypothetical protein